MHWIATERDHKGQRRRIVRGRLAAVIGAVAVGCGLLATLAFAAGTNDRKGSYTCTARVLDLPFLTDPGQPLDITANRKYDPCEDDSDALAEDSEDRGSLLYARTAQRPSDLGDDGSSDIAPKAGDGADAKAGAARLDIPLGDSGYRLQTTVVQTHAFVRCHCAYPSRTFRPKLGSRSTVKSFGIVAPDGHIVLSRTTATSSAIKYDDGPGGLPFAIYLNRQRTGTQEDADEGESGKWIERSALEIIPDDPSRPMIRVLPSKAGYEGNPCEFGSAS